MKRLNKLSDEELAAYIEGILSTEILEKSRDDMDVAMFELLHVAMRAGACMPRPQTSPFSWGITAASYKVPSDSPLLLAGFVGLEHDDEQNEFM